MLSRENHVERVIEEVMSLQSRAAILAGLREVKHNREVELTRAQPLHQLGWRALGDRDLHARVLRPELAQRVDEERGAGTGEGADAERPGIELRDRLHFGLGADQALEDLVGVTGQRLAGVGEPDRPRLTVDEDGPEFAL